MTQNPACSRTAAIEALLVEAQPRLAQAYVSTRGLHGAEDAAAEAVAWGIENSRKLEDMQNPIGYLYRVGLSRTRHRRRVRLPAPQNVGAPQVEPDLIDALRRLPIRQRTAVWLVHGCGWTLDETAQALRVSKSTANTHCRRALERLRLELGHEATE